MSSNHYKRVESGSLVRNLVEKIELLNQECGVIGVVDPMEDGVVVL